MSSFDKNIAISIHSLHKSYGSHEVLKGIDLDVFGGELFGFIGKNGVGKSTTIECSIGIKDFQSGWIEIGGYDIKKEAIKAKQTFGYVTSEPTSYEEMSGLGYVEFIASVYKVNKEKFKTNFEYLAGRLDLSLDDLYRPIKEYSHGMKQKLCLIASLIHNPKIWILDEPTVGLDAFTSNELCRMMREFADHGKTVFVASHNIDLIARLCDRVAIINKGTIQKIFSLKENPRERYHLNQYFLDNAKEKEEENGPDVI